MSAVQRGNVIYVKNEDLTEQQKKVMEEASSKMPQGKMPENKKVNIPNRYEGYTAVRVETGLSNSDMVEIKSGINEGQRIAVTQAPQSSNPFGMMGMGGGMPGSMGGGMPSGGMSGSMGGRMPSGGMSTGGMR